MTAMRRVSHRRMWPLVIPVLLLAAWLGFRGLNADALWYDEWLSVYYAGGAQYGPIGVGDIWARVAERSTWPPGFQSMLAGWGAVAGWSNVAARLFPLLLGLLAIAWMYRLGRDVVSARAGLAAAVFVGVSAFFDYYLHELRGYTMYVLFSAMCVWAYWRILRGRVGVWTQATLVVGVVGVLYTHYFAALAAVAIAVYHLLFVPKNRAWWRVPILMAIGAALFLPWAQVAFSTAQDALLSEERRIVPLHAGEILQTVVYSFSNGSLALLALLLLYSLAAWRTSQRKALLLAWVWLASVLGIALLANERLRVIFHIRHLMAVWPALALVCAFGIESLARRGVRPLLLLGIWMIGGLWLNFDPAFINEQPGQERTLDWGDLSAALDVIGREAEADDVVLYHVEEPGREWLQEPIVDYYTEPLGLEHNQLEEIPGLQPDDDYYWQLIDYLDGAPHVWFVDMPDVPSPYHVDEFKRVMDIDYAYCRRPLERDSLTLDLYARQPRLREIPRWEWGDDIGLFALSDFPTRADTALQLELGWRVLNEAVPPDTYSYGIHLVDSAGNLVAQADGPLPQPFGCAPVTLDVSALPAGDYRLYALLYNWQTGERLDGSIQDGAPSDRLLLETVVIQ